jgi:nucleotide-binding universal stress UspA family protein
VREAEHHNTTVLAVLAWSYIDQQPTSAGFDPHHTAADADRALEAMIAAALTQEQASGVRRQAVCDLPARALLDAAAGEAMLVVGARGLGGFKGLLVGSVSQHCVHAAVVPTVVVRDVSEPARAAGVVVGVDGSDHARGVLAWAVDEARRRAAPLTVVHGYDRPVTSDLLPLLNPERLAEGARRVLDDALATVDTSGLDLTVTASPTGPAGATIDAAGDADLVVVGSRGLGPVRRLLLGSVATQVLHHAPCTVAIIPTTETTDA